MINVIFSLRNITVICFYCISNDLLHIRSTEDGVTWLGHRVDSWTFSTFDQSSGSILQPLTHRAKFGHGLCDVLLQRQILGLKQIRILRDNQGS